MKINPRFRNHNLIITFAVITIITFILGACTNAGSSVSTTGEESGTKLTLDERYDSVRDGARLVLKYDKQSNSFKGFVENRTGNTLIQVRIEVHLSNGIKLGPTTPIKIDPGGRIYIDLEATEKDFDGWTALPEVGKSGNDERGNGEQDTEHDNEGGS
jgi:hypothetical protein